jgi:HEAT repeat protein
MPLFGPPNVEKLKARRDIAGLVKALAYKKDSSVRKRAAGALGKIGWKPEKGEAEALYLIAQRKWDECVKIGARAVEPLIAALKDGEPDMRKAAAGALAKIGDARAVEPLIAALKDGEPDVRKAAVGALGKIGWKPDKSEAGAIYLIARRKWDECVKIGAPAVKPLIAALKDKNWRVRKAAAEALVNIYREGRLTEAQRRLILAERPVITAPHNDEDSYGCGGSYHVDMGIGVPFPL